MYQTKPENRSAKVLPTMYDLPCEDPEEPGLPNQYHLVQSRLLEDTFRPPNYTINNILVARDLYLYYDVNHPNWHKRPDWFAVLGVDRLYQGRDLRLSYVVWDEKVHPFVVVELLSPGTEKEDLGQTLPRTDGPPTKWQVYEEILQIPYYFVFDEYSSKMQAFKLRNGRYLELELEEPRLWIEEIQLGLGLWQGNYLDLSTRQWLRWYDLDNNWIPIPEEKIQQERQRADLERQLAKQEKERAEKLAAQLRALGIEPDL